jgi:hypothetical protein
LSGRTLGGDLLASDLTDLVEDVDRSPGEFGPFGGLGPVAARFEYVDGYG